MNVSVIIPTYNRANYLLELINSLLKQSFQDFEIIIVDDGSTDNTREIVKKCNDKADGLRHIVDYKKEESLKGANTKLQEKIKYFYQENKGPSEARNIGIKESKGDISVFLDDDAIVPNNFVQAHLKNYANNNVLGLRGKIKPKKYSIYNYFQVHYDLGDFKIPSLIHTEGNCSFRRDILLEVGGFKNGLFGGEGDELSVRIINKYNNENCLFYCPEVIIYHDYANSFFEFIQKTYRHGKEKGKVIAKNNFNFLSIFLKKDLKELLIPSFIYWWNIYKKEKIMSFKNYISGVLVSSAYIYIKKFAEIIGYIIVRIK